MAAQVQQSSLAKKLGARLVQANKEFKDAPVDLGNMSLPAGIKGGKAQITKCYIGVKKDGEDKGKEFFMAMASIKSPEAHNGYALKGRFTRLMINLYDTPAKGQRKAKTFNEYWGEFLNFIKSIGESPIDTEDGAKLEAYYNALCKKIEKDKPFIEFSTRGWVPPATPTQPKPAEMVFEEWHGKTDPPSEGGDPVADGMTSGHSAPPTQGVPELQPESFNEFTPPTADHQAPESDSPTAGAENEAPDDPADVIMQLVQLASSGGADPTTDSDEIKNAKIQLAEMAVAAGATTDMVNAAASWEDVGSMALGQLPEDADQGATEPTAGAVYKFRKRDSKGNPLVNKDKQPFPPAEVEIVSVDAAKKLVTAKTKDGKMVNGLDKKPVQIKWEWLE